MDQRKRTFITIVTTAAVTFGITATIFSVAETSGSGFGTAKNGLQSKLNTVNSYLKNNYLYDDYDISAMEEMAVKGYVEGLNEPYTHYYTAEEFEEYISAVEDSYVGIGVVISIDEEAGKIIVVAPVENSPAYMAGILPGDYILEVDGTPYSAEEMNECVSAIKSGKEGTNVNIKIERGGQTMDINVERREISNESVDSKMLDNNIGYVRITAFNTSDDKSSETTYTEFVSAVEELKSQGMQKMIIDLRDNPGGVLDVVCDIADYLLPEGIITYTETKDGKREEYRSDASEYNIPMAVIINKNSASASEILTGALKDYDRAEIIGETSYGKGIVQSVYPFMDGSGMSMTIAKYYSPNGICIHGVGIEPDYAVSLDEKYAGYYASSVPEEDDTQLKKAVEVLSAN